MSKETRAIAAYPGLYKPTVNTNIMGLIKMWSQEDESICTQLGEARDQIFVNSAGGVFLDNLAANVGVYRPIIFSTTDSQFRELIPVLSYWPKQVRKTIYKIFDIYWGEEYSRATLTSQNYAPYGFADGDTLMLKIDGSSTESIISIRENDVVDIAAVTVDELTTIIDNHLLDISVNKSTSITGKEYLRISTNTVGGLGSIEVTGGCSWAYPDISAYTTADSSTILSPAVAFSGNGTEYATFEVASVAAIYIGQKITISSNAIAPFAPDLECRIENITGVGPYEITVKTATTGNANWSLGFYEDTVIESTQCAVYEINPKEIVIKIPNAIPLNIGLKGSMHLHEDSTIEENAWVGSFVFNEPYGNSNYSLRSAVTSLNQDVVKGQAYSLMSVLDSSDFPNELGYLAFDFGYDNQEILVPYHRKLATTSLVMDSSYIFEESHASGSKVHLCSKGAFSPNSDGSDYAIFIHDTEVAQELMSDLLDYVKAAGVLVRFVLTDLKLSVAEFGPVVDGVWIGLSVMTTAEANLMTAAWGAAEKSRQWFDSTTKQLMMWNGITPIIVG